MTTAEDYCRSGHRRVGGWLGADAGRLVLELARSQSFRGHVGEIGVYQGKLFILLALLRRPGEHALAVDLFDQVGAGGNHIMFRRNLVAFHLANDVTVKRTDSTTVSSDDLLAWAGGDGMGFRLFSVDGGHTAEVTASDLASAFGALAPGGLLLLDDYYNETWPGVAEATNLFLREHREMVPIGTGFNKMLFTNGADHAARYRSLMRRVAEASGWRVHERAFHGQPHMVLKPAPKGLLERGVGRVRSSAEAGAAAALDRLSARLRRGEPQVTLVPDSGAPGTTVTVSGSGFGPGESVEIRFRTGLGSPHARALVLAEATTGDEGAFTCAGTIPDVPGGPGGPHKVVARGSSYGLRARTTFTVA